MADPASDVADITGIDAVMKHVVAVRDVLSSLKRKRDELEGENVAVSEELAAKRRELATAERQIEDVKRSLPSLSDDEKVNLDVGGRTFTVYRSTLMQIEGSMLATLASSRWSDGMRLTDGALFLDMNPDAFEEVVDFLRRRRVNPRTRSRFSGAAVELALYLGMPIDHIKDGKHVVASFIPRGSVEARAKGQGIVFSLSLPHPHCGMLTSLKLTFHAATQCTVYTKGGDYEKSLAVREDWKEIWEGFLSPESGSVPLSIHLANGHLQSFYIACSTANTLLLNIGVATKASDGELLTLKRAGGVGRTAFEWPPKGRDGSVLSKAIADNYFIGDVQYVLFQP